eukprot:TRINITY_DN20985_c0_g1_i1.p1 TRINITY_DN20985_c0_g1~~TRINITY_DN20985_c0_g1_i1.p1  ORF type:complete len:1755 (-),score=434.04 TRINITY_DN20985_c0_g1_i1:113-4855(-)
MFEGSEAGPSKMSKNVSGPMVPQVQRSNITDAAKHPGSFIHKIYWMPSLEMLTTVEGTESVYFWSPNMSWETPRMVTPQLPSDFFDEMGKPLWTVHAVAWDNDAQDLVAVLSNRYLITWRLRNREKGQFQQKRELRFNASRAEARSAGESKQFWKVHLCAVDPKTGELAVERKTSPKGPTESQARREKREARLAAEASTQLDVWWNASMRVWVTTDRNGRLFLWDLSGQGLDNIIKPVKVLTAHTKVVTSHLELSKFKFTTCSLDRSVMLWDNRNLSQPEVKIEDLPGSVLSQAYLPLFSSLVTVGCEKRVYVWSIDHSAYRGVRAKLSAHQSNLLEVSAGQRVFFTLDEACTAILWDGATLAALQTTNMATLGPRHAVVMPSLGRICLAGRRLNFFDGNEQGSIALGAAPTKEQLAKARREAAEGASLKDRAVPRWCGLGPSRGNLLSATQAEVRVHGRVSPGQSRVIFNAPEGDSISAFGASDALSFAVAGTAKGGIYFLKYRSGFALRVYPGRRDDLDEWQAGGAGGGGSGAAKKEEAGADTEWAALGVGTESAVTSPVAGSGPSERAMSPAGRVTISGAKGVSSPTAAAAPGAAQDGAGPSGEDAGLQQSGVTAQGGAPQNSPTAEDIQRGLSSSITCVLPVEEQRRVYVGTAEGRVIIFSTLGDYPALRWVQNPEDLSPVTCIHVAPWAEGVEVPDGEEPGLLAVGTQDGQAHIYSLANLRLAGSVNIPRALPDPGSQETTNQASALRQMRLLPVAAELQLPVTLLTVDSLSRVRFWGLKVHACSGRLQTLKLLLDAGQLRESDCVPTEWMSQVKEKRDLEAKILKKREEEAKAAKAKAAKEAAEAGIAPPAQAEPDPAAADAPTLPAIEQGLEGEGENKAAEARSMSEEPVRFTAIATLPSGPIPLPYDCIDMQPYEGPSVASQIAEELKESPYIVAIQNKAKEEKEAALNPPQSTTGASASKFATGNAFKEEEPEVIPEEFSGSDTDGDDEETVGWRFAEMPRIPSTAPNALMLGDTAAAEAIRAVKEAAKKEVQTVGEGASTVYLADSGGWIWCIDVEATLSAALIKNPPIAVALDAEMAAKAYTLVSGTIAKMTASEKNRSRMSFGRGSQSGAVDLPPSLGQGGFPPSCPKEEIGMLMGLPPKQKPEEVKVTGAWPAHGTGIASLVITGTPPAIVSVDTAKEVKIWSGAGDIWGHFSLRSTDGQQPAVGVWPPPHTLAAQRTLMKMAKGLCRRLGFHISKSEADLEAAQRLTYSKKVPGVGKGRTSGKRLSPSEMAARRAKKAAAREAEKAAQAAAASAAGASFVTEPDFSDAVESPALAADETPAAEEVAEETALPEDIADAAAAADEGGEEAARPDTVATEIAPDTAGEESQGAGLDATDPGALRSGGGSQRPRRAFSNQQMREMIRNHAFSSGFQSYKQFNNRPQPTSGTPSRTRLTSGGDGTGSRRESFFGRAPSAFGVELISDVEKEAWESGVRTLGRRSASEGALLRYAQASVAEQLHAVKTSLGVDVTKTTRKTIKKPSFIARLDVSSVSQDPNNPNSATAQAVKRLTSGPQTASSVALPPIVK